MQSVLKDIVYAVRKLRRSPEFAVVAVVTLGLGIGANTAMFTVVETVLLRPLPYNNPERLVQITASGRGAAAAVSWLDYVDIQNQSHALESVAVTTTWGRPDRPSRCTRPGPCTPRPCASSTTSSPPCSSHS